MFEKAYIYVVLFALTQVVFFAAGWVIWALLNQLSLSFTGNPTDATAPFCAVIFASVFFARDAYQIYQRNVLKK